MNNEEIADKLINNDKTHFLLMEKIDTLVGVVNDIKVSIAGLPQEILNSADCRYASKASETRLQALETRIESRSYDWLRYAIITSIGVLIALVGAYKLKL